MQLIHSFSNFSAMFRHFTYLILWVLPLFASVTKTILKDNPNEFVIRIDIDAVTEANLFPTRIKLGLPSSQLPETNVLFQNKSPVPFTSMQSTAQSFEWSNQQEIQNLETRYEIMMMDTVLHVSQDSKFVTDILIRCIKMTIISSFLKDISDFRPIWKN
mgnify:CR=1 FL=1